MGCDIFSRAERRVEGVWQVIPGLHPFLGWRSYALFGFLADVRNYSAIPPLSPPRGLPPGLIAPPDEDDLPDEEWLGAFSFSWLSVDEMLAVDYEQTVEDRRANGSEDGIHFGAYTLPPGSGRKMTLREFLGIDYFAALDALVAAHAERIVFGFGD